MKTLGTLKSIAGGLIGLLLLVALTSPSVERARAQGGQAQGGNRVTVVNPATQPVPTAAQGTTMVSGTVQAQQSGGWTVALDGTSTVQLASGASVVVANPPGAPVAVVEIHRPETSAYQIELNPSFGPGFFIAFEALTVPDGKRFVIEYVSGTADLPVGQTADFQVTTSITTPFEPFPVTVMHRFPGVGPRPLSFGGILGHQFRVSQQTKLYADAGVFNEVEVLRGADFTGVAVASVRLTGYLVDLPE